MNTAPLTTAAEMAREIVTLLCEADWTPEVERVEAILTAYAAQVRPQWQDIATHPKDHFPCLVCHKDRGRMVAFIDVTGGVVARAGARTVGL
jgi:hypothetical protein